MNDRTKGWLIALTVSALMWALVIAVVLVVIFCLGVTAAPIIDHIQPLPVPTRTR